MVAAQSKAHVFEGGIGLLAAKLASSATGWAPG